MIAPEAHDIVPSAADGVARVRTNRAPDVKPENNVLSAGAGFYKPWHRRFVILTRMTAADSPRANR